MAYSGQFLRVSWLFDVLGTEEIADTSLNYTTAPGWTGAVAALGELAAGDVGPSVSGDLLTLLATSGGRWADYSRHTGVKIAAVGTDGHYLTDPYVWEDATPSTGIAIGNPIQCTTVLTLNSGFALGKGNYGRMYLPHFYMSGLTASPYTDSSQAEDLADAGAAFLNAVTDDINDLTTAVLFPAIMGQTGSGTGKGVTEVRVGNVTDTQRRRRNRLTETYAVTPLA